MHRNPNGLYRFLSFLVVSCLAAHHAAADTSVSYHPPRAWHGEHVGEPFGNPVPVEDEPRWGLYQLEGKDPSSAEAVQPMVWGGSQWVGTREFGGQPSVSIHRKTVTLASRGSWAGSGNTKGLKTAAVGFFAPDPGAYTFAGSAQAEVWQGRGAVELVMYHYTPGESLIYVDSIELDNGSDPVEIEDWHVTLEPGEGLILAAIVEHNYTAANVRLRSFTITHSPEAQAGP